MSQMATKAENCTALKYAARLGIDGNGAEHFWSDIQNTVFVSEEDGDIQEFDLDETPCENLGHWVQHTRRTRGWETVNYIDGDELAEEIFGTVGK